MINDRVDTQSNTSLPLLETIGPGMPESPYEPIPEQPPKKRPLTALEDEQEELAELRGDVTNHWD